MFVDIVNVKLKAGHGGNGIVAFRREKYVAKGGPAGGSGGKGGSIIFIAKNGLSTLLDLRYSKHIKGYNGSNGQSKSCNGKDAEDTYVHVPLGTVVYNAENDEKIGDLVEHDQTLLIAKGGKGGRGNKAFVTSKNTAPEICENGEPGEEIDVRLELKLLADVGLVGLPSVGKSSLITVVSAARPKVADYHFTTLKPVLGVVSVPDGRNFVMADLPGLIEGASDGVGLGHQFLRHIERCKVILHVVDVSGIDNYDPYENYVKINNELKNYNEKLLLRPQIIVCNKMDAIVDENVLVDFKSKVDPKIPIIEISTISRLNIEKLLYQTADLLDVTKLSSLEEVNKEDIKLYKFESDGETFNITLSDDNVFVVQGKKLEKIMAMTDFNHDQSIKRFARKLRSMGIDQALRDKGVQNGDVVRVLDFEFEFID